MNKIEKLTPKIFNNHKKFMLIFIDNIQNILKKDKQLQFPCNNLNFTLIPNPLK